MVGDILHIRRHVARCSPSIGAGDIEGRAELGVSSGCGNLRFARVIPFEDAIGGNLLVEHSGQGCHFEVLVGSDEAAAVASSFGQGGEGHHIASFQLEGADAVVELCFAQGVHVAAGVLGAEGVVDRLALKLLLGEDSQGSDAVFVGHDDAALVPNLHLAVAVVDGLCTIYLHFGKPMADGEGRLYFRQNDNGMLGVDDVHQSFVSKGRGIRNLEVHVVCDGNLRGNFADGCFRVGCQHTQRQTEAKDRKDVSLHG